MSVHGEYERTLENLILHLGKLPADAGPRWTNAFSALRIQHQPDLSTAARESLALLERMGAELPALSNTAPEDDGSLGREGEHRSGAIPPGNILNETASHLRAHCQAILGVSGQQGR